MSLAQLVDCLFYVGAFHGSLFEANQACNAFPSVSLLIVFLSRYRQRYSVIVTHCGGEKGHTACVVLGFRVADNHRARGNVLFSRCEDWALTIGI